MHSALNNPQVIEDYLAKERRLSWFVSPLPSLYQWHISRLRVIRKGHTLGKWWLITDLSYPLGASVNDGIAKDHYSLSYIQ